ncbi:MAG: hypothetical protein FJ116_02440 [Deltaproteobacteria bacterium]|nr:hypothetical protein [Deltaproteobacteria bacterium]
MDSVFKEQISLSFVFGVASIFLLSQCGGVNSVYYDGRSCIDGIGPTSSGSQIYAASCTSCHQSLASSTKKGASLERLNNGIAFTSQMKFLECLTSSQRSAVISALASR